MVVFPTKKKWSYFVENVYEAVKLWAEKPFESEEAAKEAALAKLEEMEMVFAQDDVKIGSDLGSQKWWVEYLPVPKVIEQGSDSDVGWLATHALPGRDATDSAWAANP